MGVGARLRYSSVSRFWTPSLEEFATCCVPWTSVSGDADRYCARTLGGLAPQGRAFRPCELQSCSMTRYPTHSAGSGIGFVCDGDHTSWPSQFAGNAGVLRGDLACGRGLVARQRWVDVDAPGVDTPLQVPNGLEAVMRQELGGGQAPHSVMTVDHGGPAGIQVRESSR